MNEFESVKQWLLGVYNIRVSEEWLAACLEWIQQECQSQGDSLNVESLKKQVFEQWLLSDLGEIGEPVLPQEIGATEMVELASSYALQLLSCVDIGFPLYGQCQKLQGKENPNAQVSAEQPYKQAWEPKPSRMLFLELSDGHTTVKGMEYQLIKGLHPELPGGTKIHISGPVLCRRGVFFLTGEKVQVLGGEVDALMEQYNPYENLKRAMEKNREDEGKSARTDLSGEFKFRAKDCKGDSKQGFDTKTTYNQGGFSQDKKSPYIKQEQVSGPSAATRNQAFTSNFPNNTVKTETRNTYTSNSKSQRNHLGGGGARSMAAMKKEESGFDDFNDELDGVWDDDLDYNELFKDEMEVDTSASTNSTINENPSQKVSHKPSSEIQFNTATSSFNSSLGNQNFSAAKPSLKSFNQDRSLSAAPKTAKRAKLDNMEEDFFDDDLELLDIDVPFSEIPARSTTNANPVQNLFGVKRNVTQNSTKKNLITNSGSLSSSFSNFSSSNVSVMAASRLSSSSKPGSSKSSGKSNPSSPVIPFQSAPQFSSKDSTLPKNNTKPCSSVTMAPIFNKKSVSSSQTLKSSQGKSQKTDHSTASSSLPKRQSKLSDLFSKSGSSSANTTTSKSSVISDKNNSSSSSGNREIQCNINMKSSCSGIKDSGFLIKTGKNSNIATSGSGSSAKHDDVVDSVNDMDFDDAVDFDLEMSPPQAVIHPFQEDNDHLPFQYLSQVIQLEPPQTVVIKAYISTLTDKLNSCGGTRWSLCCKINDGTASIDVEIANAVLTDLIGFSAQDSVGMRQRMKTDPQEKERLMKGLGACQQKLVNMSCLMEVEFPSPSGTSAIVRKLIPANSKHILELMNRIKAS